MHQMRNKYMKHICEIEESLHIPGKENKEQCIQMLKKQHRDKMKIFKEVLEAYQERIKKNNKYWEDLVQHLKNENNQLIQEKIQSKQEFEKWENQKTKILEGFSQKMDLLHNHQISTLKELQITRFELERVQEMLKPQQEIITEKQENDCLQATSEAKISDDPDFEVQESYLQEKQKQNLKNCVSILEETEHAGTEKWATVIGLPEETQGKELYLSSSEASKEYYQEKACMMFPSSNKREDKASGTNQTKIAEAQIRLEKVKQTLNKKEEEITELLKDKNQPENDFRTWTKKQLLHSDPSSILLLKKILEKFHPVYSEVPEARQFIDCLLNENNGKAVAAKETLNRLQQNVIDSKQVVGGNPTDFNRFQFPKDLYRSLEETHAELWEAEMTVAALGSITSGCISEQLYSIMAGSKRTYEAELWLNLGQREMRHPLAPDNNINFGQCLKDNLSKNTSEVQSPASPELNSAANELWVLQAELKQLKLVNKNLVENFNYERTLRKMYYNMVQDLKGKICVFCRIRPLSKFELARGSQCIVQSPDQYTITIQSNRGAKEFQFDQVFNSSTSQEEIFKDTSRLIQSAVDGYNVCIFAYGQTCSGKTFTMIGEKEKSNPGIIPRAFKRIFQIVDENYTKFTFKVSAYMLELYNEQLLDLFITPCDGFNTKLEIKKDKKGSVYIQGAEVKEVTSAEMLYALFEQGCINRHTAATKMNMESSQSHLIVGVMIKSTNLINGSITCGKLSLVDLAGSERASKTEATDEQLKVFLKHILISCCLPS
ncbi:uncharacterized protein si:dkey-96l17.6 [Pristis pectinata]|uniref:uncharacterized protein si:dkey-96l17.6 n=1 Tax=Pristis pectinata TaxID=685728 RepID=UPI00223E3EB0|nr:uncharacterized protein si:dkey-96l17.6 [Pristis pectinata]